MDSITDMMKCESQERFWLTIEDEIILSELGMEDPTRDPADRRILDSLEELLASCENEYMRQILEHLLDKLEAEL